MRGSQSVGEARHWLAGRLAVVTGASRGIGAATAEAIAAAGAHVVLAARDGEALDAVARRIRDAGGEATAGANGRQQRRGRRAPFRRGRGEAGRLAALVCAAAVLTPARFTETTSEIWDETLGVNLTGSFLCCRAAFTAMRAARRRADRQHRVAVRRLRHREVPWTDGVQRLQIRGHRSDRGDRRRGQGARDQRDLRQSRRGGHRDAASGQPRASSRPDARSGGRADRGAARQRAGSGQREPTSRCSQTLSASTPGADRP